MTCHSRGSAKKRTDEKSAFFYIAPIFRLLIGQSLSILWTRRRPLIRLRQRCLAFVRRIPFRPAFENALGDSAPLRNLSVVCAHPVGGNRDEPTLFSVASEAQPPSAVFARHRATRP